MPPPQPIGMLYFSKCYKQQYPYIWHKAKNKRSGQGDNKSYSSNATFSPRWGSSTLTLGWLRSGLVNICLDGRLVACFFARGTTGSRTGASEFGADTPFWLVTIGEPVHWLGPAQARGFTARRFSLIICCNFCLLQTRLWCTMSVLQSKFSKTAIDSVQLHQSYPFFWWPKATIIKAGLMRIPKKTPELDDLKPPDLKSLNVVN